MLGFSLIVFLNILSSSLLLRILLYINDRYFLSLGRIRDDLIVKSWFPIILQNCSTICISLYNLVKSLYDHSEVILRSYSSPYDWFDWVGVLWFISLALYELLYDLIVHSTIHPTISLYDWPTYSTISLYDWPIYSTISLFDWPVYSTISLYD